MSKYIADCYPEGQDSFRGIVLGNVDGQECEYRVFNIESEQIVTCVEWEIDTPIVEDVIAMEGWQS